MSRIEKALEKISKIERTDTGNRRMPEIPRHTETGPAGIASIPDDSRIVTLQEPASQASEEYRKLKSIVLKRSRQNGFQNTFVVTSSLPGEGKSLTALNLAVALSQEYDNTALLIDADMRRNAPYEYVSTEAENGLSDCLSGRIDPGRAIVKTGLPKLSFLPAGKNAKNPVELVSSGRMRELIREIRTRYSDRYVIIDAPPLLPFAETLILGSLSDGIIFVVREGYASIKNISEAMEILKEGNVLGFVYNGSSSSGLNGYYSYYYHSGSKEVGRA